MKPPINWPKNNPWYYLKLWYASVFYLRIGELLALIFCAGLGYSFYGLNERASYYRDKWVNCECRIEKNKDFCKEILAEMEKDGSATHTPTPSSTATTTPTETPKYRFRR